MGKILTAVKPYLIYALIALWLGSVAYAYHFGGTTAVNARIALETHDQAIIDKTAAVASGAAADAIAKLTPRNTTIREKATETIRENTVYVDCKQTEEMKTLIQESRRYEP